MSAFLDPNFLIIRILRYKPHNITCLLSCYPIRIGSGLLLLAYIYFLRLFTAPRSSTDLDKYIMHIYYINGKDMCGLACQTMKLTITHQSFMLVWVVAVENATFVCLVEISNT